jgi:hypothetical protein
MYRLLPPPTKQLSLKYPKLGLLGSSFAQIGDEMRSEVETMGENPMLAGY